MMKKTPINAQNGPKAGGGYAQAIDLSAFDRLVLVSGQIPEDADGAVPDGFEAQCRQVWANIEAQLVAAGMTLENIVKVTTFLSSRDYRETNSEVRNALIGHIPIALTVIICDIYDEAWLLEIEAIAAR